MILVGIKQASYAPETPSSKSRTLFNLAVRGSRVDSELDLYPIDYHGRRLTVRTAAHVGSMVGGVKPGAASRSVRQEITSEENGA